MFIKNNFTENYFQIIEIANKRCPGYATRRAAKKILGYTEKHHIIPKSLGGSDDPSNLVWLTAAEHLQLHLLLINMIEEKDLIRKMYSAVIRMCNPQSKTQQRIFNSNYDDLRKECAKMHSDYMKIKHSGSKNPFFNKKHSEESKKLISLGGKGLKRTNETRKNLSLSKIGNKNPATLIVTCPHCNKTGKSGGMRKHHFNHCKFI